MTNQSLDVPEIVARHDAGIFTPKSPECTIDRIKTAITQQRSGFVVLSLGQLFTENERVTTCAREHFGTEITEEALVLSVSGLKQVVQTGNRIHIEFIHKASPSVGTFSIGEPGLFSYESVRRSRAISRITASANDFDKITII